MECIIYEPLTKFTLTGSWLMGSEVSIEPRHRQRTWTILTGILTHLLNIALKIKTHKTVVHTFGVF